MFSKALHSMIRVLDEETSKQFYKTAFDLSVVEELDFDEFKLIYLQNNHSDFELELTVNKGRTQPYNLGDGYGHIAFVVDDIDAHHKHLENLNFEPKNIVEFNKEEELIARFFFVSDPDGYQIEVLQKLGRFK
jgi:lactoylglutathione lyase